MKLLAWHLSRNDNHDWSYDLEHSTVRFWNEWNGPAWGYTWSAPTQSAVGYRTEVGLDGNPYTVKWQSMSYQSNGAGRVTLTTFLVADGFHQSTGAGPQGSLAA